MWSFARFCSLTLLALSWLMIGTAPAWAVTVTFDVGPGGLLSSYTENGITVAPVLAFHVVDVDDHDSNLSRDLLNRPVCCSTPYEFTYSGGAFSVAQFDFVLNAGPHVFTSSSGAMVSPGASGTVVLPAAGWTGITSFRWDANGTQSSTETALMDNLQFCPGDCSDGEPCTTDACNPSDVGADVNGCTHVNNSLACSDGLFCNGADTCAGGTCSIHAGNPCATGTECADACDESGDTCFDPSGTPCTDDGDTCTFDECNGAGACVHPGKQDGETCDDGDSCTTDDVCASGDCVGDPLPQNCNDNNPCTLDTCNPQGGCLFDPAGRDGFVCDDTNPCTNQDVCDNGICQGTLTEADTDGDGFCDIVENDADCNINDAFEIPPRPNTFAGAPGIGPGEGLLNWAAPTRERFPIASDPACATSGVCGPIGFCTAGKIWDPCGSNGDCDQPPFTCQVVVNYAEIADLTFISAKVSRGATATSLSPATPGCSRKASISLDPLRFTSKLKLKVKGTIGGRRGRDTDRFLFQNF